VRWLAQLAASGTFPHTGVLATTGSQLTPFSYEEWDRTLQQSFEQHFWVPQDSREFWDFTIKPEFVNRRGIYKVCCVLFAALSVHPIRRVRYRTATDLLQASQTTNCARTFVLP
jgi:hypothetical protein